MKKYLFIATLGLLLSSSAHATVQFCYNEKCAPLNEQRDYPKIYTAVYGIFKNAIAENLGICDSDSSFKACSHNGIQYFGKVGVSDTNFQLNSLSVIDTKINPANRNLEIINDYYTYVNGRRVLCTAAKDVLTLNNGNASLIAMNISCPYAMQTKSTNSHTFAIRVIDLDRKFIGVEYAIKDAYGATSDSKGYAIIDFSNIPTIDFNKVNQDLMADYDEAQASAYSAQRHEQISAGITPPPSGMTGHIPTYNSEYNPREPGMQKFAPKVAPPVKPEEQFSYRSSLPYPWGYYYAPEGSPDMPKEIADPKALVKQPVQTKAPAKRYSVEPLPMDAVNGKTANDIIKEATVEMKKDATMQMETIKTEIKEEVKIESPVLKITNDGANTGEVSIGVFNEETFLNSVPK